MQEWIAPLCARRARRHAKAISLLLALGILLVGGCGLPTAQNPILDSNVSDSGSGSNPPAGSSKVPSLRIEARPVFCCNARSIIFEALSENLNLYDVVFSWDFGDRRQTTGSRVEHTFSWPGVYIVVLEARAPGGEIYVATTTLSLAAEPWLDPGLPTGEETGGGAGEVPTEDEQGLEDEEPVPPAISDQKLRCIVNLSGHALNYASHRWANAPLMTDLSVFLADSPNPRQTYDRTLEMIRSANPEALVGTYISGSRVESELAQYPPEAITAELIPPSWLIPGTDRVNLANAEAASVFGELILGSCVDRPAQIVFVDNIIHPSSLSGWTPWHYTCRFLSTLRDGLNAAGKITIANVAVAPWGMSDEDVGLLSGAVDGMSFEVPYHPRIRGDVDGTNRLIQVYRYWLNAGKTVVLIPVAPIESRAEEARLVAGLAMMTRNPGDRLFVAWPFFQEEPDWADWPAQFGQPLGDYEIAPGNILVRQFELGEIRVDGRNNRIIIR